MWGEWGTPGENWIGKPGRIIPCLSLRKTPYIKQKIKKIKSITHLKTCYPFQNKIDALKFLTI